MTDNTIAFDPCLAKKKVSRAAWNGGKSTHSAGYVLAWEPDHPRQGNGYVMEHIRVVERAMGKLLRASAVVHHVDENKANNAPANLVACDSRAYHMELHRRQRALDACGYANAVRCSYCGEYDRQDEMYKFRRASSTRTLGYHRDCYNSSNLKSRRRADVVA